jgi:hypothetical protein
MSTTGFTQIGQRAAATWPLAMFGLGLVGLLGTVQVLGELLYILECAGAVGGDPAVR